MRECKNVNVMQSLPFFLSLIRSSVLQSEEVTVEFYSSDKLREFDEGTWQRVIFDLRPLKPVAMCRSPVVKSMEQKLLSL